MERVSPLGGLHDQTRDVVCDVFVDGRRWIGRGTWIDRADGPSVVLALRPPAAAVVIDHEPATGARV